MKSIRRLYFYLVAFISAEVVLWGGIGLLRSMVSATSVGAGDVLARALALVLVGVPVFLFHWLWAQRAATGDAEEQTSLLRALFFFTVLGATLVPVVQNTLAWLNRLLLRLVHAPVTQAIWGGNQTWQDNLIAIFANLVVAAYFWHILRQAWESLPDDTRFADARRLYRFFWLVYALVWSVAGVRELLMYLFADVGVTGLGTSPHVRLANGLAAVLIAVPLWLYTWHICQRALGAERERASNLRLGVLYFLGWGSAVITVTSASVALFEIFNVLLGASGGWGEARSGIGEGLAMAIPMGALWFYYGNWLLRHIALDADPGAQAGKRRLYHYLLALIGLGMTVGGAITLLLFLIDLLTRQNVWGGGLRERLSSALSLLVIGLPLWLSRWPRLQTGALDESERGENARHSLVRKVYLYIVIFAAVIGGMAAAVGLVFNILSALLSGPPADFWASLWDSTAILLVFAVLLGYHLRILRGDMAQEAARPVTSNLVVWLADSGEPAWASGIQETLQREVPGLTIKPLTLQTPPDELSTARAVILPSQVLPDPPWQACLQAFDGLKLVVGEPRNGWFFTPLTPAQAIDVLRQMAAGEPPRRPGHTPSAWRIVQTIATIIVGLQLVGFLLTLLVSIFSG